MLAKYLTALPAGAAMTFLVLFSMQALIAMQPAAAVHKKPHTFNKWIHVPRDESVLDDRFRPDAIPDPVPAPPIEAYSDDSLDGPTLPVAHGAPTPRPRSPGFTNIGFSDGPLVAVVRVQPTYPSVMSARGIEGFVTVVFDVMTDGTVSNVAVLESSHRGFERAAVQAASRFRFKARVVDGNPEPSTGIRYRFSFELDK